MNIKAIALLVSVLALCESYSQYNLPAIDITNAEKGDWIFVRIPAEPGSLNPILSIDATADEISSYIYETLNFQDPITYE